MELLMLGMLLMMQIQMQVGLLSFQRRVDIGLVLLLQLRICLQLRLLQLLKRRFAFHLQLDQAGAFTATNVLGLLQLMSVGRLPGVVLGFLQLILQVRLPGLLGLVLHGLLLLGLVLHGLLGLVLHGALGFVFQVVLGAASLLPGPRCRWPTQLLCGWQGAISIVLVGGLALQC